MISEQTLFILGAGASCPYGYPSGAALRDEICSLFVSDSKSYFKSQGPTDHQIQLALSKAETFREKFYNSSTKSIDLFLARNPEFRLLGKWAIIFRIFAAEQNSAFREHTEHREQDWYSYLFERLTDELVKKEDYARFSENKVAFITFNYDRSLEHFLYESLLNSFNGVGSANIKQQVSKLRFIHVFGQVAGLDWQDFESRIEYRRDISLIDIQRLADRLRIIYEENDNPELKDAQRLIAEAQRIFFLGFGYGKENLEILNCPRRISPNTRAYGTCLGLTEKEIADTRRFFVDNTVPDRILGTNPARFQEGFRNMDCLRLLKEFL